MYTVSVTVLILGVLNSGSASIAHRPQNCDEFSEGVTFTRDQATGVWYLVDLKASNDPTNAHCVQFFAVDDQERKELQANISKYVKELNWENLELKMQIPCHVEGKTNNKSRDYYLEKMGPNGSYKSLQMPPLNRRDDASQYGHHPMRLKLVEGKYLAMMDCLEHFAFVLDKTQHGTELDPAIDKLLQIYTPDEH